MPADNFKVAQMDFAYGDTGMTLVLSGDPLEFDLTTPPFTEAVVCDPVALARLKVRASFKPDKPLKIEYILVQRSKPLNSKWLKSLATDKP